MNTPDWFSISPSSVTLPAAQWKADVDPQSFFPSLKQMIGMRLHLTPGVASPFEFLECHKIRQEKVLVFVVVGDDNLTLEDDWALFPSDTLITQLLLLKERNK